MSNSLAAKTQLRDIGTKFFRLFQPPPLMTVDEWADEFRELSTVSSAKGGRWRTRSYQREPMRVMTERTVRSVCICGAAQIVGKSEMLFNFIGRQIHLNPGPILLVEPTNDLAERVSKKRLQPMFEITPALRPLVAEQKSRATANTIRAKTFPGGTLNISGANTPNELCSDPIRDVLIDEVDRCNEAAGKEGDIVTLAEQRQGSFGKNAFSLYVSTPSGKKPRAKGETQPVGVSKILVLLNESDNRHRFCPCQKCGHEQELLWAQFQWRDGDVKNTRFYCASCDHPHTEQERRKMIDEGRWVALNPSVTDRAGFFLPGMYSLSDPDRGSDTMMEQMARNFLRAKHRGKEALRAWVNTFLCECFADDEDAEQPEGTLLLAKREPYGETIPKDVLLITVGVDVQAGDKNKRGRLEAHIVGWAENEVPWVLDYQVFAGDPEHPSTWAQLESFIANTTYITEDGRELIMERVAVDSGHVPDTVYAFCQPRGVRMIKGKMQRVIAVKGFKGVGLPVMNLPRKSGVKRTRLWLVSTNTAKIWAYSCITKTIKGEEHAIHFPSDREPLFGEEYFRQLTADATQKKFAAGLEYIDFIRTHTANEALATLTYAYGALKMSVPAWGKLKAAAASAAPEPAPAPPSPKTVSRPAAGWVGGWTS